MKGSALLLLVAVATVARGYVVLEDNSYIQLNDANGQKTINASTYNRVAFDYGSNVLYNTGTDDVVVAAIAVTVVVVGMMYVLVVVVAVLVAVVVMVMVVVVVVWWTQ